MAVPWMTQRIRWLWRTVCQRIRPISVLFVTTLNLCLCIYNTFVLTLPLKLTNFTSQIFRPFFLTLSKLPWSPGLDSLSISLYLLSIYVTVFDTLSLTMAYAAAISNKLICFGWDFFILCNIFQFRLIRLMSLTSPKSSKCEKRFNLLTYY